MSFKFLTLNEETTLVIKKVSRLSLREKTHHKNVH